MKSSKAKERVKPFSTEHPKDRVNNYLLTIPPRLPVEANDCRRHKFHLATPSTLLK